MTTLWPASLWLLISVPLLAAGYVWIVRRRRPAARFSSLALVRDVLPRHPSWRRHLPAVFFLAALASLITAAARPAARLQVPAGRAAIILALDVSRSMCATDVAPSRLQAAQAAALSFVQRQDPGIRIGVVAFAGYAELVQPLTNDPELLEEAIASLAAARRTAIGSAILQSLEALIGPGAGSGPAGPAAGTELAPLPEGEYASSLIVLLTDGASNTGPEPEEAAQAAAARGVRVYTIGFGTENPGEGWAPICGPPRFQGGNAWGGGGWGGGGGGFRRGIDVATLRRVAETTGGAYYSATSAVELQRVFESLPVSLITEAKVVEVSAFFAVAGGLLAALAVGLSLRWSPLP